MKYYLSVDGGGTKTAFLLTDESGKTLGLYISSGCTYSVMGAEKVLEILKYGCERILEKCSVSFRDVRYAVWGISCFGEYSELDRYLDNTLPKLFPASCGSYLCNDVEIGLAGSLLMKSGVHIVAGTGAVVMGKNADGRTARSNGWHEIFSDEGSAHWLGMKALSLFAKQADSRIERGRLYRLFYEHLQLEKDMDIIKYYKDCLEGSREKIAALQKILLEAAAAGDYSAVNLYKEAAWELAESVAAVVRQLDMKQETFQVSYYGGAFKAGEFLLKPLTEYLKAQGLKLAAPILSPLGGGILMAADRCGGSIDEVIANLKAYEEKGQQRCICI